MDGFKSMTKRLIVLEHLPSFSLETLRIMFDMLMVNFSGE